MEFFNQVLDLIGKISMTTGFDAVIIVIIVLLAQLIKQFFAPSKIIMFIILFSFGVLTAIFNILFSEIDVKDALRLALGYPVLSMAVYMYARKKQLFKKYLKSTEEIKDEKDS